MPKVLNKYRDKIPEGAVGILRGSPWGNPFVIGPDGTREDVVAKYAKMVAEDGAFRMRIRNSLRGKDLVCCCAPLPCHGDVLLAIAND